ncbi:uncharacterized protein BX664DRAFT_337521 [Halteromyces radiatus]|uniref:uncharacterized protein n=1 Tax=Halteromyces radiatus TaxID=101107 RepID=UPI00221F12A6|nr:uncharacterized protein BX664DRAFT_337521 [Halteromyces radiatus]KAI8084667.1 hypothetical protein BX664DRAFT_337521 [Halteromyces radiatus]
MVFHSSLPSIQVPTTGVVEFLFENRNNVPDNQPILIDAHSDRTITFGQLKQNILQFAAGLQDHCQFKTGDVLAIFAPNLVDYPIPLLGALAAGGTTTPANPAYTVKELTHQVSLSDAKVIVCSPENVEVALETAKNCGLAKNNVFVFGETVVKGVQPYTHVLLPGRQLDRPATIINPADDASYLCFSSGTTGLSKGVHSTHTNITANILQINSLLGPHLSPKKDRILGVLPFFHIFGLTVVIHMSLFWGIPLVVMTKFDLVHFCETVQKHKISFSCLVPPILLLLAKHPVISNYDLSSLRYVMSGAAPLSAELGDDVQARLPNLKVTQGYGLTETSPVLTAGPLDNIRPGTSGILVPNVSIKIITEDGKEAGINERGELWCKGPSIMKGYIKNPEATADCIDSEGYFHTGDIAIVDEHGHYSIVDRIKELIKYKGFQVPPAELESLLLTSPIVADCAVIGVYDTSQATELPRAYVVLQPSVKASDAVAKELMDFVASKVVQYKRLRGGIRFIDAVPKSASGKLLRRVIKDWVKKEEEENSVSKAKL